LKFETEASLNWMELEKNKTYLKIEKAFTFPHLNKAKKKGGRAG